MKIEKAMLMWNPETREVRVVEHPLPSTFGPGDWHDESGAAYAKWSRMTNSDRARHLFASAIRNSVEFNIPITNFHDAILQIDGITEFLNESLS
jgi:hypothetical protein